MGTSPGKEYTRDEALDAVGHAITLICDAVDDSDGLMYLVGLLADTLLPGRVYNRETVMARLNDAANAVLEGPRFGTETGATIAQRSLIDLLVNTAGAVLDNQSVTLDEAIKLGWAGSLGKQVCDGEVYGRTADGVTEWRADCGKTWPHVAHDYQPDVVETVLGWLDDLP